MPKYPKNIVRVRAHERKGTRGVRSHLRLGGTWRNLSTTQRQIGEILYNPSKKQQKPELLTVLYPKKKEGEFKFLEQPPKAGGTYLKAKGYWREPTNKKLYVDGNIQHEVQFLDTKDDRIGKRLMRLLQRYNDEKVGEQVLYARTVPISETTLK